MQAYLMRPQIRLACASLPESQPGQEVGCKVLLHDALAHSMSVVVKLILNGTKTDRFAYQVEVADEPAGRLPERYCRILS